MYFSQLNEKDQSMLEERIKRTAKTKLPLQPTQQNGGNLQRKSPDTKPPPVKAGQKKMKYVLNGILIEVYVLWVAAVSSCITHFLIFN